MGILDAEIRQENGRSLIMVGDSVMEISQALVNLIDEQNQGSSSIRLGIRATDIQISPQRSSKYYMPAEVYVVETFGYRNIITCRLQDQHLIQSVSDPSLNFDIQDTAWLNISEDNIHIFSESGKSISHPKPQQMIQ